MRRSRWALAALILLGALVLTACPAGGGRAGPATWDDATWDDATWN